MTSQERLEQLAAEYKAGLHQRIVRGPLQPGYSGPLPHLTIAPEDVDAMEAAINEAFEQIEAVDQSDVARTWDDE